MKNFENWRQMLLKLPDADFFLLMQTWLGEIQTPFNKHQLVQRLETFLTSEKIRNRIIELIDPTDAALLSAVKLLARPAVNSLYQFCHFGLPLSSFTLKLINLEQRMLIFREKIGKEELIQINPLLIDELEKKVINLNTLFPTAKDFKKTGKIPWLNDTIILALYSFIERKKPSLKNNGRWKKKEIEELSEIIPHLARQTDTIDRFELVKEILINLKLVKLEENYLIINDSQWLSLAQKNSREVFITLLSVAISIPIASITLEQDNNQSESPLEPDSSHEPKAGDESNIQEATLNNKKSLTLSNYNNIELLSQLVVNIFNFIPPGKGYPIEQFKDMLKICKPHPLAHPLAHPLIDIIHILAECDIIIQDEQQNCSLNALLDISQEIASPSPAVILEANYDTILKPWTPLKEALLIPQLADITICDLYPHYHISKDSFIRALRKGFTVDTIIKKIEQLTQKPLVQNISQTFREWSNSYALIKLTKGVVLKIDPTEMHSIKEMKLLDPWIIEELAPNIFLLNEKQQRQWMEALEKSGITQLPSIEDPGNPLEASKEFPKVNLEATFQLNIQKSNGIHQVDYQDSKKKKGLIHPDHQELQNKIKELKLSKEEREEYLARIDKKLILYPEQIIKQTTRFEKRSAKGLDFRGKIAVINHAVTTQTEILEIQLIQDSIETQPLLLFPLSNKKENQIQTLQAIEVGTEKKISLDISHIKSVRRLQSALFCPK